LFHPSTLERVLSAQRDIDVLVIGGEDASQRAATVLSDDSVVAAASGAYRWPRYALAIGATLAASLVCGLFYRYFPQLGQANVVMVYLLSSALVAVYGGRRAALVASVLGVLSFDFMFVPPRYSFAVSNVQYLITFGIMLSVALIIANLNASVRLQARVAGHRERRTALLYAMTRQLAQTRGRDEMADVAASHVSQVFASRSVVLFPDEHGRVVYPHAPPREISYTGADLGVA
jgi:two-component system, OmpR family, sensor histidine kinase KdpD